ncbi:MAG: ABC transporter substrate-binding protein [Streptosporangiaceae bacterium]
MTDRLRIGACLSLSGKFARFGRQAAAGLEAWRSLTGVADLIIEDDDSDRERLAAALPDVARRCDLLLGPYSTVLMRTAGRMAAENDWLIWNQGGTGDDVETAHPGHVVSVLTPASRYAEPFLRLIADERRHLVIVRGTGSFGRQVADGAMAMAAQLGIRATCVTPDDTLAYKEGWDLFSAGVFEDDVGLVTRARGLARPPGRICAVAAGVGEFSQVVNDPDGIFGIAQWFPGSGDQVETGPSESSFLDACTQMIGTQPDYPAAQAAAGAALAIRCAELAASTGRGELWDAAVSLETTTLFGAFGIDRRNGTQVKHATLLVRWERGKLVRAMPAPAQ